MTNPLDASTCAGVPTAPVCSTPGPASSGASLSSSTSDNARPEPAPQNPGPTDNWQAQAALLQRVLLLQPQHLDALQMLGILHGTHGDPLAAADYFGRACVLSPHDSALRMNLARALHESGQHDSALAQYEQLIGRGEADAATWTDRGTVLRKLGRREEALHSYREALAMAPQHGAAWSNQGNLLHELGRFTEALTCHERALDLQPGSAAILSNKAAALEKLERLEAALDCLQLALELDPDNPVPWSNAGVVLRKLKRFDASLAHHDRAVALQSDRVEAWTNRALTLNELQRFEDALQSHDRALELDPDRPEAWLHRGVTLNHLQRHAEAADQYTRAIALQPDLAQAWLNRAIAQTHDGRHAEALADFDRAIDLLPLEPAILVERANALHALARTEAGSHHSDPAGAGAHHRYENAVENFDAALAMDASLVQAWMNRAVALAELNRVDEALADLARAIAIEPDCADAHFNAGVLHLSRGDYAAGWQGYEYRWSKTDHEASRHASVPRWDGRAALDGKRLLVWAEQGYGDMLQFCRYLPMLAARHAGAEILFEVPASLSGLCASLPGCRLIVQGNSQGDSAVNADWQVPLMSLPLALGATDIPASIPYLTANPTLVREWRERLGPASDGLRIGIACSGNPRHKGNALRSVPLALLARLQRHGTLTLLQNQLLDHDRAFLAAHPEIADVGERLTDFSATAAVVANMDLVVSVDTSLAHLAGALGKPVWVVLPWVADWRWLRGRSDSPWYPTARLFRNPELEGWRMLDELEQALAALARQHATQLA